jgi:hypothetical protein
MTVAVFCDVRPCSLIDVYRHFGGRCPEPILNTYHITRHKVAKRHFIFIDKLGSHGLDCGSWYGPVVCSFEHG